MTDSVEIDQFQILEEKIDKLIEHVSILKKEKESLSEKVQIQDEKLVDLNHELDSLRSSRDMARQKVVSLLEKIEQIGF